MPNKILKIKNDAYRRTINLNLGNKQTGVKCVFARGGDRDELAYDLALKPSANVSRSPGFETALGIFGGSSD